MPKPSHCHGRLVAAFLLVFSHAVFGAVPGHKVFQQPDPVLTAEQQLDFYVGQSFTQKPWVIAPSTTIARDGLGPLFNAISCSDCHHRNGKAVLNDVDVHNRVLRLGQGVGEVDAADPVMLALGGQVQTRAIPGVKPEAVISVTHDYHDISFVDGELITLRQPVVHIKETVLPVPSTTPLSLRTPGVLAGMGLLEAVDDATLLNLADPEDTNRDGISGRVNRVPDRVSGKVAIGRFGWKAGQPSIQQQVAAAFSNDMGITSRLYPVESCTRRQKDCRNAHSGGSPEVSDDLLGKVVFYVQFLAMPEISKVSATSQQGEKVFREAGCSGCHVPQLHTSAHAIPELAGRQFRPYTDLLLHDMGEGLADNRPEYEANGREWRTAPLWGLGSVAAMQQGQVGYLHDGRARTLMEAILWHGGEAQASRTFVLSLPANQRQALVDFLQSL